MPRATNSSESLPSRAFLGKVMPLEPDGKRKTLLKADVIDEDETVAGTVVDGLPDLNERD
jgi:hypothetical protein